MGNSLDMLMDRVEKAIELIDNLEKENKLLKSENSQLKTELNKTAKAYNKIVLKKSDDKEKVKNRLVSILDRVEMIENMTG